MTTLTLEWKRSRDGKVVTANHAGKCVAVLETTTTNNMLELKALYRSDSMRGWEILTGVKRYAVQHGFAGVSLQDAAKSQCVFPYKSGHQEYDLSFWHLLHSGQTYYQAHGFNATLTPFVAWRRSATAKRVCRQIADVPRALAAFCKTRLHAYANAVEAQVRAMRKLLMSRDVNSDNNIILVEYPYGGINNNSECSRRPHGGLPYLIWHRRRLARDLTEAVTSYEFMGQWLRSLPCEKYAVTMMRLFGDPRWTSPAVESVGQIRTPHLRVFQRANAYRVLSHMISWEWRPTHGQRKSGHRDAC